MQDSLPLISILMTAFNRQKYIAEAIDSVRASSYTNWELIIVDDGSTDETVTIAKRFAAGDPIIKLFINLINLRLFRIDFNFFRSFFYACKYFVTLFYLFYFL